MGHAAPKLPTTGAEFLEWEAKQTVRHEFPGGIVVRHEFTGTEIVAMAGASEAHVTLAGNVYLALRQHLAGSPCRTFIVDMRLYVEATDAYCYPDVVVCCGLADTSDPLVKRSPLLLVEVLSPSTAACDRGEKFAAYRSLAGLREVLFIDPNTRRSELFRRGSDGLWVLHPVEADEPVSLQSVELSITAAALWAEVPPAEARQ